MFWGTPVQKRSAVDKVEKRPNTAPLLTISSAKKHKFDPFEKKIKNPNHSSSLQKFSKVRVDGNERIFSGSLGIKTNSRPKTIGTELTPNKKRKDNLLLIGGPQFDQPPISSIRAHDEDERVSRGKLFPVNLCICSYEMSAEGDIFRKFSNKHVIGTPVDIIDMSNWDVTDSTLQLVSRIAPQCTDLSCPKNDKVTDKGFVEFFFRTTLVSKVDISGTPFITDSTIETLAKCCKQLKELNMSACFRMTDDSLAALGENSASLRVLYASECPLLADNGLIALSRGCRKLVNVDFSYCPLLTDRGLRGLVNRSFDLTQVKCNGNEIIDCSLFRVPALGQEMSCNLFISCQVRSFILQGCAEIDDEKLSWLGQACMQLKSLDISNCPLITSVGVDALSASCTQLEALNIIGCGKVIDYAICGLAQKCPGIRALDLAGHEILSDMSVSFVISSCLRLNYLNLSGLSNISDTTFVPSAEIAQEMEHLKGTPEYLRSVRDPLRSLHLTDVFNLSDASLGAIGILYSRLHVLDISNCHMITSAGIAKMCKFCTALKSLSANYCPRITDKAINYICRHCIDIETLCLSARKNTASCNKISNKSLKKLLANCLKLKVLEMKNRLKLTGADIKEIAAIDLRSITLAGCTNMKPMGVAKLALGCPKLFHINISRCKNLPRKFVDELYRVRIPYCEIAKSFHGISPASNACLLRHQLAFSQRSALEHSSAKLLQERWRDWLVGEFTLMYLIIWIRNLKRKADVDRLATAIQKRFRGKLGRNTAYRRKQYIFAVRIQKLFRLYYMKKQYFISHKRDISAELIQAAWKHYLFKCTSLNERVRNAKHRQFKIDEAIRKRREKLYFSAREIQQGYRAFRAKAELQKRRRERKIAIHGSALIVPRRMIKHIEMDAPDRRFFFRIDGAKRYPGRFCQQCVTSKDPYGKYKAHAIVICFACGKDLCPACDAKLHREGHKFAHHPKRLPLRVKLPSDPRFEPPLERAEEIRQDWHELVEPVIKIQNRRYRMLAELRVVVAAKMEKLRMIEEEKQRLAAERRMRGVIKFQAYFRRHSKVRNWPNLQDKIEIERETEEQMKHDYCATVIQSLFRGFSIRIWVINLPIQDRKQFWHGVQTRLLQFLPSRIEQLLRHSLQIREKFSTTLKPTGVRYKVKERLWGNREKSLSRKLEKSIEDSRVSHAECKRLIHFKNSPQLKLADLWNRHNIAAEQEDILKAGRITQIELNKLNGKFLETRIDRERRRDAVLVAAGLAIDKAFVVLDTEKENLVYVLKKIKDLQLEPDEEVEDSDEDVHDDSDEEEYAKAEKKHAERMGDKNALKKMSKEEIEELKLNAELDKKDREAKRKAKVARKQKEKEARQKYRQRRHEKLIAYRQRWLISQTYKIDTMLELVEKKRYELAKHAYSTAVNEIALYKAHEAGAQSIARSVSKQIRLVGEDMRLQNAIYKSEVLDGEGSKMVFDCITWRVSVNKKRRLEQDMIINLKKDLLERDLAHTLERERFVVPDWNPAKMKWKVQVRTARFGTNDFDVSNWLALYHEKPWGAHLRTDKIEPAILRKQNKRFDEAIIVARRKQDTKAEEERVAKEKKDREDAIKKAKLDKKLAEQQNLLNNYGEVLSELLTEVSEELRAKKLAERRANKTRFERLKEDVNMFFNGDKIRAEQEKNRIIASIHNKQKGNLGYIEGIESIKMIVGKQANEDFQALQDELTLEEMPHYKRLTKTIDTLVVWYHETIDNEVMITDLAISHADPNNFYYKSEELRGKGYHPVRDQDEKTEIILWYAQVRDNEPLETFDVSFTLEEERSMLDNGLSKIKVDLGYFGLPPSTFFWQKKHVSRICAPEKEVTEAMVLKKIKGYQEILAQDDTNTKAIAALRKLEVELQQVYDKKKQKAKNKLKAMVEFLAMSEADVMNLMASYKEMDEDDSGEVSLTEFFDYIDVDRSVFGDNMFKFLDEDNDGQLDFPELVNAVGTYCMFGVKEWLLFAFGMFDPHGNGYILEPELRELLVTIHGDNPLHTGGVDRVMDVFDRNGDGKVEWDEFESVNRRYASMFMPIFTIQKQMQKNFLGQRFWNRKKHLFVEAREHMKNVRVRNAKLNKNRRLYEKSLREREAELARIAKIQEEAGVAVTAVPGSNLGAGVPFVTKAQLARAAYNPTQALKKMAVANEELTKKKEQEDFVESRKGFNERAAKRKEERTAKRQEKLTKAGKVTRRVKI